MILKKNINKLFAVLIFYLILTSESLSQQHLNSFNFWKICSFVTNPEINWLWFILILKTYFNINVLLYLVVDLYQFEINLYEFYSSVTTTLTNGLFLIHPALITLTYVGSFILILKKKKNNITKFLYFFNKNAINYIHVNLLFLFSLNAIFLGSWWANQELGWGGWWSWDSVELVNLIMLVLILIKLHEKSTSFTFSVLNPFLIYIFFHFSVRYDLFNSIHTFTNAHSIEYLNLYIIFILIVFVNFKKFTKIKVDNTHINLWVFLLVGFYYHLWFSNFNNLDKKILDFTAGVYFINQIWHWIYKKNHIGYQIYNNVIYYFLILTLNIKLRTSSLALNHVLIFSCFFLIYVCNFNNLILNLTYYEYLNIDIINDWLFLISANLEQIFVNLNVLENFGLHKLKNVPFYLYSNYYQYFVTSDLVKAFNLSYSIELYYLVIVFLNFYIIKNISKFFINRYKRWCI